ncbi:hypothetical protein FA15DRAFT_710191 [Coprinopsis marcescibilis]|uniref:Uncharacterized protein n=1 Tax=Coprinopsis marcescibilis TaxID=230819 RepID=A0A5C3KE78_COPMA|nr:hypothetical protein FA15DRAFT_710191 [Coprinopsis marcescibilis]
MPDTTVTTKRDAFIKATLIENSKLTHVLHDSSPTMYQEPWNARLQSEKALVEARVEAGEEPVEVPLCAQEMRKNILGELKDLKGDMNGHQVEMQAVNKDVADLQSIVKTVQTELRQNPQS